MDAFTRFWKKYATFTGRASRSEFWWVELVNFVITVVLDVLARGAGFFAVIGYLYGLAIIVPSLALGARRLHDIGKSGWWQLIAIIPIVGWIILIVWQATAPRPEGAKYDVA